MLPRCCRRHAPGADTAISKAVAKMAVGRYDWSLARRVMGRNLYFLHQVR